MSRLEDHPDFIDIDIVGPNLLQIDVGDISQNVGADQSIAQLSKLSLIEYDQVREKAAKDLNIRVSTLDREVAKQRQQTSDQSNLNLVDEDVSWHEDVNGVELFNEVAAMLDKHVVLPDGALTALILWCAGSYCFDNFRIWPKLTISSPEKRCGKTTLLETIAAICNRSLVSSSISPAAIYRVIEAWQPTLMIDEADTFIHGKDELRGFINSGHTKSSAYVIRTVGDNHEPAKFSTWCPMVIAMIKLPPDTILDRSVLIQLRRKLPGEAVLKLPLDFNNHCSVFRQKLLRWAIDNQLRLQQANPLLPFSNNDRALDNWTPLFAIAEIVGGDWPKRVKIAFELLNQQDEDEESIGPLILSDIKEFFDHRSNERVFSEDLTRYLINLEERPWAEWKHGKPMTQTSLSKLLKPFRIKSDQIRIGHEKKRGYEKRSFRDAFNRYLSADSLNQSGTTVQAMDYKGSSDFQSDTEAELVPPAISLKTAKIAGCTAVPLHHSGYQPSVEDVGFF